jgi:hypothetical protein
MLAGCLLLLAGAVLTLAAIQTTSATAFLAGVAVAGAGSGRPRWARTAPSAPSRLPASGPA